MTKREFTPIRRATTLTPDPAIADPHTDSETPWQQLMVVNYVLYEVMDAMAQERATEYSTPMNQNWQQFLCHLRLRKPELCVCLEKLIKDLLNEQGGGQ